MAISGISRWRNRYLDACWKAAKVHVEIDGAHHMDVKRRGADMMRENEV